MGILCLIGNITRNTVITKRKQHSRIQDDYVAGVSLHAAFGTVI